MGTKVVSHFFGIAVAIAVVASLVALMYISSDGFAAQIRQERLNSLSLEELEKIIGDTRAEDRVEAVLAVGKGKDRLIERASILGQAASSADSALESAAEVALCEIGEPILPAIRELLATNNFKKEARWGCAAARVMGPAADGLFPELFKIVKEGDTYARNSALFAFQTLSRDKAVQVLEEVIDALDDPNFNVQCSACRIIERIGPDAKSAVQPLIDLSKEGNVSTRGWAARALGAIGPVEGHDVAKALEGMLTAFAFEEKRRALIGLASMGPAGISAKDEVEKMMTDDSRRCMPQACATYVAITGETKVPLSMLSKLLQKESYRIAALECLGAIGPDAAPLTREIAAFLTHAEEATRETAALTLGRIGPGAKGALGALKLSGGSSDPMIRQAVKEAIESINRESEK